MRLRSVYLLLSVVLWTCADDSLHGQSALDLMGSDVRGAGGVRGRLCDRGSGAWLGGATVSVDGTSSSTVADSEGRFELQGLSAGQRILRIEAAGYVGERVGMVVAGEVVDIGVETCVAERGNIEGRVCDDDAQTWLSGGTATLTNSNSQTTVDGFGAFRFNEVPVGEQQVVIEGASGFSASFTVSVQAGATVYVGDRMCGPVGGLRGRICYADEHWLANAVVSIQLGDGTVSATSDGDGFFEMNDVPAGTYRVDVQRGNYTMSFAATIVAGQVLTLSEPACMAPTRKMAVLTTPWWRPDNIAHALDSIEEVLKQLGNRYGTFYSDNGAQVQNADGNLDLIDGRAGGSDGRYWIDEVITNPSRLAEYSIIFFNCRGYTAWVTDDGFERAMAALADFVHAGGSVYASDEAIDVIAGAFPASLTVYDGSSVGPSTIGPAKRGFAAVSPVTVVSATVVDAGLLSSVGHATIDVSFNLPNWMVLGQRSTQPAGVKVLVVADVQVYQRDPENWSATQIHTDAPLMVSFTYGAGRVLFTSFHNEAQSTDDMQRVLEYAVFEL